MKPKVTQVLDYSMRPRSIHTDSPTTTIAHPIQRIRWWYGVLLCVIALFVVRVFYVQVIRHDYYQKAAFKSQLKQYEIPATRGVISAYNGDKVVPVVLNETLYTLYADPTYVKDPVSSARALQPIIGGDVSRYEQLLRTPDTRYVILAKKLSTTQKKQIESLKIHGLGVRDYAYRTYPDGSLASQLLGFVNDDEVGTYGIEEVMNDVLAGKPGQLKAITDAQGVPLPANKDNTVTEPVAGDQVVLTLDVGMQQQTEDILREQVSATKAKSGSVVIMDTRNGAIKAMANYPTYDPSKYGQVKDPELFNNTAVTAPLEVGSIMKALTAAAALDQGVVTTNTTYYDPASYMVDNWRITNVEEDGGAGTKSVKDILQLSLNTGATWLLMQMGGGELNKQGRERWYDYMSNHYRLGKETGIEQGFESAGNIPDPNKGYGRNLTYANTAFGQGMTATPLQMLAAFSAIVNGGTYYQPHLVDKRISAAGKALPTEQKALKTGVVSGDVSSTMRGYLEYTLKTNAATYGAGGLPFNAYSIGGKTGTAQISKPGGGYYEDRYNGTYLGYVGGNTPQYAVVVRMSEPTRINGYAGAKAAAPVFARVAGMLINTGGVAPRQ